MKEIKVLYKEKISESQVLIDAVSVDRRMDYNILVSDGSESIEGRDKFINTINFPKLRARIYEGAVLRNSYMLFQGDKLISDNFIYSIHGSGGSRRRVKHYAAKVAQKQSNKEVRKQIICNGDVIIGVNEGSGTWGHWLIQTLPSILLCLRHYPDARVALPASYFGSRSNFGDILKLYKLESSRVGL